jgi:hypothetical protein
LCGVGGRGRPGTGRPPAFRPPAGPATRYRSVTMTRLAATLVLAVLSAPGRAADPPPCDLAEYYVLLFGGLAVERRPQTAHTWATFVKATPGPDGSRRVESFTISWLPATLKVRPYAVRPEPGRNLTLAETLDFMKTGHHDIALWGPYRIDGRWYGQAAAYKAVLEGGSVQFRTLDRGSRADVNHCVHAVAETDPALLAEVWPVLWYGERITQKLADAAAKVGLLADHGATHDWVVPALGLDYDRDHIHRHHLGERRVAH